MRRASTRPVTNRVVDFVFWFFLSGISWLGLWVLLSALILQWAPVAITSGSMSPSIRSGDVVLVEPYDGTPIHPGTVAVFREAGSGHHVTHRVVSTYPDGTYMTRGDANAGPDSTPLHSEQIVGVGRLLVPFVALPLAWLHNGQWLALGIYLSGLSVMIALGGRRLVDRAFPGEGRTAEVEPAPVGSGWPSIPTVPLRNAGRSRKAWPSVGLDGAAWLALAAIGLALLLPIWSSSAAAYTSATDSSGNRWEAATLAAPSGLQASVTCSLLARRVDLSWTAAPPPAQGYKVYRSTNGGNFSQIATVNGGATTSHRDTNVSNGNTYTYVIRTFYGTWLSPASNQASATIPGLCL